jgi:gamma-glutamyltranspeptidase/glutathione hydrolase
MAKNGGLITRTDMANYEPLVYTAPRYTYRGYEYVTGGNVTLVETLNILECFELADLTPGGAPLIHLMIEAMRLAWADTVMWVGDPRGDDTPWQGLTSKDYAQRRAAQIDLKKASREIKPGDPWRFEGRASPATFPWPAENVGRWAGDTTKMITMDAQGNVVSLVTSLGAPFGSKVTIPGTGILLNSSMERLDPRPGYRNSVAPGKGMQRLTSAVLIFRDSRPFAATCGSLSIFISGMGLHTIVNLIDFGMGVQEALDGHRFHPAGEAIWIDDRLPQKVLEELELMGHRLQPLEQTFGQTHFGNQVAIKIDPRSGTITAGADALHPNAAAGF